MSKVSDSNLASKMLAANAIQAISYEKQRSKPKTDTPKDSANVSAQNSQPGTPKLSVSASNIEARSVLDDAAWLNTIDERPAILMEDEALLKKACAELAFATPDFLPALYYYFEVHNKQLQLLEWAIKEEVNHTAGVHDLFRGDSVATHLFYVIFFGDLGKRYLRATMLPLVKLVLASKAGSLEVDPAKVSKDVDTEANARLQIEFSMKFLEFLNRSSDMCPLILREALSLVRKHIASKFPNNEHILGVIIFLRFFCPTLVFPLKHGLMTETELGRPLTEDVERGLVLLSKTMQSLANGVELEASKPYAVLFNTFIKDYNPRIREFADDLINEKFIRMSRRIIEASVKPPDMAQISEAEEELKAVIAKLRPAQTPIESPAPSVEGSEAGTDSTVLESKLGLLEEISQLSDTNWKKVNESKSNQIQVFRGKEDSQYDTFFKIVTNSDVSLLTVKKLSPSQLEEWDTKMFFAELLETFNSDFSDWHTLYHPPIFASPRDYVTSVFRHSESEDKWFQVTYSTDRPDHPPSKKISRAEVPFKALVVEKAKDGKGITITQFIQDENLSSSQLVKDFKVFKKYLKSHHNAAPKREK
eukprot:TRINITY_DN341_c0_g1_i2.p1 TRINITY_DN341_c0_g1~~TRINITY_DN341_c0_g1_i2.p1  ORF type:complete len:590 (-),score=210.85 TRINITY_DN341_c0_g1_i2:57-1826(-)